MNTPTLRPDTPGAHAILVVDDEPHACKWFVRLYGDEFVILTACSLAEALALMATRGHEVAVVLTDYHMPGGHGVDLLSQMHANWPHVSRLLVSAYADKNVAMAAVNQGQVERILEKPFDEALTRQTLREALRSCRERQRNPGLLAHRAASLHDTLDFLFHEVATPLATVSGYLSAMKQHQEQAADPQGASAMLTMLDAAQHRADDTQSLLSTLIQTARDAARGARPTRLRASDLVQAVRSEYPFEADEARWLSSDLTVDFELPGQCDLLLLVLFILVKNALIALRAAPPTEPRMTLALRRLPVAPDLGERHTIVVCDNGSGVAPHLLEKLTRGSVSTREESNGHGTGLVFCQRVMVSLGGSVSVACEPGVGTCITLHFPSQDTPYHSPK